MELQHTDLRPQLNRYEYNKEMSARYVRLLELYYHYIGRHNDIIGQLLVPGFALYCRTRNSCSLIDVYDQREIAYIAINNDRMIVETALPRDLVDTLFARLATVLYTYAVACKMYENVFNPIYDEIIKTVVFTFPESTIIDEQVLEVFKKISELEYTEVPLKDVMTKEEYKAKLSTIRKKPGRGHASTSFVYDKYLVKVKVHAGYDIFLDLLSTHSLVPIVSIYAKIADVCYHVKGPCIRIHVTPSNLIQSRGVVPVEEYLRILGNKVDIVTRAVDEVFKLGLRTSRPELLYVVDLWRTALSVFKRQARLINGGS